MQELTVSELQVVNGGASDDYYFAQALVFAGLSIASSGYGAPVGIAVTAIGGLAALTTWIDNKFDK